MSHNGFIEISVDLVLIPFEQVKSDLIRVRFNRVSEELDIEWGF
jgi:hypothetical protein